MTDDEFAYWVNKALTTPSTEEIQQARIKVIEEIQRIKKENQELKENAIRMREYRFGLEGVPTDGQGNPHWADCALNHGGTICDMGPECGFPDRTSQRKAT